MKYTEIVEALKEELEWPNIRKVILASWAVACDMCAKRDSLLEVTGTIGGGRRGPVSFKARWLCADRPACMARTQHTLQAAQEKVVDIFVPPVTRT